MNKAIGENNVLLLSQKIPATQASSGSSYQNTKGCQSSISLCGQIRESLRLLAAAHNYFVVASLAHVSEGLLA